VNEDFLMKYNKHATKRSAIMVPFIARIPRFLSRLNAVRAPSGGEFRFRERAHSPVGSLYLVFTGREGI